MGVLSVFSRGSCGKCLVACPHVCKLPSLVIGLHRPHNRGETIPVRGIAGVLAWFFDNCVVACSHGCKVHWLVPGIPRPRTAGGCTGQLRCSISSVLMRVWGQVCGCVPACLQDPTACHWLSLPTSHTCRARSACETITF